MKIIVEVLSGPTALQWGAMSSPPQPRYLCLLHISLSNIKGYPLPAVSRSALRMSFKRLWAQQGGSERTLPFRRITLLHSFSPGNHHPLLLSIKLDLFSSLIMHLPPSFPHSVHSHLLPVWFILLQKFPLITFLQTDLLLQSFIIACSFVLHLPFLGTDENLNKKCNVQSSSWVLHLQFWGSGK